MFAALSVREIRSVILVDCQAETTFEASDVVFEDVWVLVKIDGFEGELSETFTSVCVGCRLRGDTTSSKLGACAVLVIHRSLITCRGAQRALW